MPTTAVSPNGAPLVGVKQLSELIAAFSITEHVRQGCIRALIHRAQRAAASADDPPWGDPQDVADGSHC